MGITGYIVAGGKSRRFGSDKARAELNALPLILRVAEVLRRSCREVVAVADVPDKYDDLNLETIADLRPGCGPVAGLETALTHQLERRGRGWILLVSCDLAGLRAQWTDEVLKEATELGPTPPAGAVAFRSEFWQPFPAAFHTDLLPIAGELLDGDTSSFQALLSSSEAQTIALPLPNDWPATPQVNTPADLEVFKNRGVG